MTPHRLEGHHQLRACGVWRFLDAVDLPVGGHDPATGGRTHLNAHAQERRMDAKFPQQGILLELPNLVANLKRRFAHSLVGLWLGI